MNRPILSKDELAALVRDHYTEKGGTCKTDGQEAPCHTERLISEVRHKRQQISSLQEKIKRQASAYNALHTKQRKAESPQTCPACKAASPGRDVAVSTPRRRFALHIARYRTNQAGQAITPLSLAMQIWVFSDDKFNKLVDRYAEHGDLRRRDLVITCTAEQYQTFDIDVSVKMLAATDDASKAQYRECKSQMSNDIERLLATPTSYEALERLLGNATPDIMPDLDPSSMDELISEAATAGNGIGGAVSTGAQNGNTAMFDLPAESHEEISGLDDLLN